MTLDSLVRALGARHYPSGWMAQCPAHEDDKASLSIGEDCGKVLIKCHAGCSQRDVIDALKGRGLRKTAPAPPWARRIIAQFDYTDAAGELLYQIVRFDPKEFRQRRPDGCGGCTWKKHPHQVLYHFEAAIVFIVEGEKGVETLRNWGFVANTNAGCVRGGIEPPDGRPPTVLQNLRVTLSQGIRDATLSSWGRKRSCDSLREAVY